MSYIIDNAHRSQIDCRIPAMPQEADLGGIRLIVLPPGPCDIRQKMAANVFDVNLGQTPHRLALNSDKMKTDMIGPETIAIYPTATEFRLQVNNPLPGCILEVDDGTLADWLEASELDCGSLEQGMVYRRDAVGAGLGRSVIQYLMGLACSDVTLGRLTLEALALGIAARGMARLGCEDGDLDGEVLRWNRSGNRGQIGRAIDMVEARIADANLSISDLAEAACYSSSRFSSVFRSIVGETPYAFILRRRAEYARDLIIGTRQPLSQIAYGSGFSSQAHMTTVIRQTFGTTPAAMRD